METRANNVTVGVFVLVAIAAGLLFASWISRLGERGPRKDFYVIFNGSVQGLSQGGTVLFSGLRVGDVTEIGINPGRRTEIRARISIDALTPVKRDTAARLTYVGLTGVAAIELSGGTFPGEELIAGADGVPPAIFAERSFVQNIIEGGQETLSRINRMVERVDRVIETNEQSIGESVSNLRDFSRNLNNGVDPKKVAALIDDASATLKSLRGAAERIDRLTSPEQGSLASELTEAVKSVRQTAKTLDSSILQITGEVSRFSGKGLKDLEGLIADGRRAIGSFDRSMRDLERNPQQFIFGKAGVPEFSGKR